MPTAGDLMAKLLRDFRARRILGMRKFRRYRIEPGDWRVMANRLAKAHDKKYRRPPHRRSKPLPMSLIVAAIDRLIATGMNKNQACDHLHRKYKPTVNRVLLKPDALRKAYDREREGLDSKSDSCCPAFCRPARVFLLVRSAPD